jgi:hypothetical protein
MDVLGLRHLPRGRLTDIDKVGMLTSQFYKALTQIWLPNIAIIHSLSDTLSSPDPSITLRLTYNAIAHYKSDIYSPCPAVIFIVMFSNHVSFGIDSAYLKGFLEVTDPHYQSLHSYAELDLYPLVQGRAGAKVFVRPSNLNVLGRPRGLQGRLLDRIINREVGDWEQVLPTALLLLNNLEAGGSDIILFLLSTPFFWKMKTGEVAKYMKSLHASIRTIHSIPGYMLTSYQQSEMRTWARHLYGLDTIIGRSELVPIDVGAEQVMRTADPVLRAVPVMEVLPNGYRRLSFSTSDYYHLIVKLARETSETLLRKEIKLETFNEYFASRLFWGASGGAPGATITWEDSGESLRLNKRGAMLHLKGDRVRKIMEQAYQKIPRRQAVQWSVAAIKFESGKQRVILNTVLEHYVIQGYIQHLADTNARNDGWYSANHDNAARISNCLRRLTDLTVRCGYMWDYADFNINHIIALMNIEVSARAETLLRRFNGKATQQKIKELTHDIESALAYVIEARKNTYLIDQKSGVIVKSARGLQSGERSTSAVNSESNNTDTNLVRMVSVDLLGYDVLDIVADKTGDDAFETTRTVGDGVLAGCLYNLTGAAGQVKKINIAYKEGGGSGEYLRMHYNARDNTVNGYPIRAMMGFIHGEFFSDPLPQPFERAAAFISQVQKLRRRGFNCPPPLLESIIRTNCRLTYTTTGGIKKHFIPNLNLVILPTILGGVGVSEHEHSLLTDDYKSVEDLLDTPLYRIIFIPSGEGKSTTAQRLGHRYTDHDTLISIAVFDSLKSQANETGDWSILNNYLKRIAADWLEQPENRLKVLLSWGPGTVPHGYKAAAFIQNQPTGLRANLANRRDLIKSGYPLIMVRDLKDLISHLTDLDTLKTSRALYRCKRVQSKDSLPHFQYPEVEAKRIVRQAKTNICDFHALARRGTLPPQYVYNDILKSAISGGWPKQLLYEAIALYAKRLVHWSSSLKTETILVPVGDLPNAGELTKYVLRVFNYNLAIESKDPVRLIPVFRRNEIGFPATHGVRHSYNMYTGLMRPMGASLASTLDAIVDTYNGKDKLDKIIKAVQSTIFENRQKSQDDRRLNDMLTELIETGKKLLSVDSEPRRRYVAWIKGEWNLIPPPAGRMSSDLVTLSRDVTLSFLSSPGATSKNRLPFLCKEDPLRAALYIHAVEVRITALIMRQLNYYLPGIEICD